MKMVVLAPARGQDMPQFVSSIGGFNKASRISLYFNKGDKIRFPASLATFDRLLFQAPNSWVAGVGTRLWVSDSRGGRSVVLSAEP